MTGVSVSYPAITRAGPGPTVVSIALVSVAITLMPIFPPVLGVAAGICVGLYALLRTGIQSCRYLSPLTAVFAVVALVRFNPVGAPFDLRLAGVLALVAGLTPLILRPLAQTRDAPVLHTYGLMFAIYGAVGAVLSTSEQFLGVHVTLGSRAMATAVNAGFFLLSVVAAAAVSRIAARRIHGSPGHRLFRATISGRRAWKLAAVSFLLYLGLTQLTEGATLGQIPVMVRWVFILSATAVWLAWRRQEVGAPVAFFVGLLLWVDIIGGVGTGSIAAGMAPVLAIFAAEVHIRRRVPWLVLALGVVLALSLNAVKDEFRGSHGLQRAGVSRELVQAGAGFARQGVLGVASLPDRAVLSASAERFAYASGGVHAYVFDAVPEQHDHWGARTYKFLPFAVVPRVFVPWKPTATYGNEFGREIGLLFPSDFVTSANLPVTAEAYLAYGWLGIAAGSLMVGILLGACNRLASGASDGSVLIGALLVVVVTGGIESDSTQAVGLLPAAFAVALIGISILASEGDS